MVLMPLHASRSPLTQRAGCHSQRIGQPLPLELQECTPSRLRQIRFSMTEAECASKVQPSVAQRARDVELLPSFAEISSDALAQLIRDAQCTRQARGQANVETSGVKPWLRVPLHPCCKLHGHCKVHVFDDRPTL